MTTNDERVRGHSLGIARADQDRFGNTLYEPLVSLQIDDGPCTQFPPAVLGRTLALAIYRHLGPVAYDEFCEAIAAKPTS